MDDVVDLRGAPPFNAFPRARIQIELRLAGNAPAPEPATAAGRFAGTRRGTANATVQLTLYNFKSQFTTQWNLLFADILLITIPTLIMYIFFNRQIVAGLTSGAIKG